MHKIGILNFTQTDKSGGGFHYIMSILEGLKNDDSFEVYLFYDDEKFAQFFQGISNFRLIYIEEKDFIFSNIVRKISNLIGIRSPLLGRYKKMKEFHIDLILSFGSLIGFHLNIPFISFIGDVMYRYFPELDEYSFQERFKRNLANKNLLKNSVKTVVDSVQSAKDLNKFFGTPIEKLVPIPLCAPPHIYKYKNMESAEVEYISKKYNLPSEYIIYPAQFWSHKNHIRLIKALFQLKTKKNLIVPAVFVGANWDSYNDVVQLITDLKMEDQIFCLGYLPEKEVVALYKKSIALVFASFAEYTNLPVVEAMVLGVPILCANTFSMPQQVGNAAILFDPFNINDIAEKILLIWSQSDLREQLISNSKIRACELSDKNFTNRWKELISITIKNK